MYDFMVFGLVFPQSVRSLFNLQHGLTGWISSFSGPFCWSNDLLLLSLYWYCNHCNDVAVLAVLVGFLFPCYILI